MKLNINKKSLFFKTAALLFTASLLEIMLFMIWEDTVAMLKEDVIVMNMVGNERMRLLKIALLTKHYVEGVEQDFGAKIRAKAALDNEMAVFEDVLLGLKDGSPQYNLKKEEMPEIINKLNQNMDKWNKSVKPMLQNMLFASSVGLKKHNQEIFTYLDDINGLVTLFERRSEEKINGLRQLQIVFLFLSGLIALGSLIAVYIVIIKPIKRISMSVTAITSGNLFQTTPVLSGDEIKELEAGFNNMTAHIRTHINSMDNEINAKKQRYEELLNNLKVGIYRHMPYGRLVEVNHTLVAMFEADSKEELAEHNPADFYKDKNRMQEVTDKLLKYGSVKNEELEVLTTKGRVLWCSLSAVAKKDKDGNVYIDNILEDITEKKMFEKQLRHSQKMEAIGEIAAGVVHEINNPLATMAVCVESLMRRLQPDSFRKKKDYERFYDYLKIIEDEIYRSKNITISLLDFSKTMMLIPKDVNINNLLVDTIKLIQLQQKYSIFIVRTNMEGGLPDISADEGQIRQVFLAIIKNAFDAMKPGGLLSVSTASAMDGEDIVVKAVFKDNGCGIPKENSNRIFEAFFTTKGHSGTGLGLSVCHKIVSQHGGRIEVKSEEGMGSTFTVILPATPRKISTMNYHGQDRRVSNLLPPPTRPHQGGGIRGRLWQTTGNYKLNSYIY